VQNALIFCNRKIEVDTLYKSLRKHEFDVGALHGDLSQPERTATMAKFKANELRLLVCSDVAARGLDITGLSHVFNFDVPHHAEDYVHRIGRTGRAGLVGHAFTLATPDDRLAVEAIEALVGSAIPRMQVKGLDPVDWAEGDGKRRGRGGRKAPPKKEKAEAKPKPEREPREAKPRAERKPRAVPAAPKEPVRAEVEIAPPPVRDFRESRDRGPRRYRDDDLGPSVRGFGDDVPAFMLIRLRRASGQATPRTDVSGMETPELEREESDA